MKRVTLRIPFQGDYHGIYLTFVVHVEEVEDVKSKVRELLNNNKDKDGAIRIDLSYGLISGRLFISDKWDVEASMESIEVDNLDVF